MPTIWKNRIIAGDQSFENCPQQYREKVIKLLKNDVVTGEISMDDFVHITGFDYEE